MKYLTDMHALLKINDYIAQDKHHAPHPQSPRQR